MSFADHELDSPLSENAKRYSETNLLREDASFLPLDPRPINDHPFSADQHQSFSSLSEHVFALPTWKYAGYVVCYVLSLILFVFTMSGPIVLYLFFTSHTDRHGSGQYGPSLFMFMCNCLVAVLVCFLIGLTETKRPSKSLVNAILLFTGACSIGEGVIVALYGFGLIYTSHVDWYLASNSLVSALVSAGQIYLLLFSCGLQGDHDAFTRTTLYYIYSTVSIFSLLTAAFRVINLTNHNALEIFHHTSVYEIMRILILPVQIEFYFDCASHLFHLGQHINETEHSHLAKNRRTTVMTELKKIYSELFLEGVPVLYKCATLGFIVCTMILLVWNVFNLVTSNRFFAASFVLLLNEIFLLVIELVMTFLLGYPYLMLLYRGKSHGFRRRTQHEACRFSQLDQILYLVSTSCSVWFSGFNFYYFYESYRSVSVPLTVQSITHACLVVMVMLQPKFLFNTVCVEDTCYTKCMRVLLPFYNLAVWVGFILTETIYFQVTNLGEKSEVIFLFPFVLMYRFASFGHSHKHFKRSGKYSEA